MTVKITPFRLSDLDHFDSRDDKFDNAPVGMQAVSMIKDGIVLAIFGIDKHREGVAEAWLYGSKQIEQNKLDFFKTTKRLADLAIEKYNLHRLEMAVTPDNAKWAEKLGFKFESVMEKWSESGEDHLRYVRIV